MQTLASRAYGQVQHRTAGDRDIEYALFEQITEELGSADGASGRDAAARIDAISRNLRLWSLLASDLLSDANALPADTRKRLLAISEFVRREGMKRLSDEGDLGDLIAINRTIMAGLGTPRASNASAQGNL